MNVFQHDNFTAMLKYDSIQLSSTVNINDIFSYLPDEVEESRKSGCQGGETGGVLAIAQSFAAAALQTWTIHLT